MRRSIRLTGPSGSPGADPSSTSKVQLDGVDVDPGERQAVHGYDPGPGVDVPAVAPSARVRVRSVAVDEESQVRDGLRSGIGGVWSEHGDLRRLRVAGLERSERVLPGVAGWRRMHDPDGPMGGLDGDRVRHAPKGCDPAHGFFHRDAVEPASGGVGAGLPAVEEPLQREGVVVSCGRAEDAARALEPVDGLVGVRAPVHKIADRKQAVAPGIEVDDLHRALERPEAAVHVPDDEVRSPKRVLGIGACPIRVYPLKLSGRSLALGSPALNWRRA